MGIRASRSPAPVPPARAHRGPVGAGSAYARLAFGPAARVYAFLADYPAWRASCRELGAAVSGPRVLDLGIGPGTSALEMARADPARRHLGLDLSAPMLRYAARAAARQGTALPLVRGDALALPLAGGCVDGVTGHSLLYLLPEPERALAEIRRVLRPGGRLALLEPRSGPLSLRRLAERGPRQALSLLMWRGMSRLHRRFQPQELVELLERAGLQRARAWPALGGFGVMVVGERVG